MRGTTYLNKVDEVLVFLAIEGLSDGLTALFAAFRHATALGADQSATRVKKVPALASLIYHLFWRHPNAYYKQFELLVLFYRREEWPASH